MDEGFEKLEGSEVKISKMEVKDSRGEKADTIQEGELKAKLESDKVEEKLTQFEDFIGKYTKQKVSEGLEINIVYGPVGTGEVVEGILKVNLPNSDEIEAVSKDEKSKQFLDVLRDAGTTYEEVALASVSSTVLHESEHMIIDSRPDSELDKDFETNTGIENDEAGHILSLLDEGITYAFQMEKDSESELFKKLEGKKPQTEESYTIESRKKLGLALQPKVKEYLDGGKSIDDEFLKFAGELMKNKDIVDMEKYVTEAESERMERTIDRVASKLHDAWREPRRMKGTDQFEPRIKSTKDEVWIVAHGGREEVDIANTTYEDLPEDWKSENKKSAEVAVSEILTAERKGIPLDDKFIESASETQHLQWLERNKNWAPPEQQKPYGQLSEDEKEKDRVVVRTAMDVYKPSIK